LKVCASIDSESSAYLSILAYMREVGGCKRGIEQSQGFSNCCGAIDGTHFLIELPPSEKSSAFRDYKGNNSIALQAIIDSNLRFLDIFVGWAGSIHDTDYLGEVISLRLHNMIVLCSMDLVCTTMLHCQSVSI
jgi:hypothetical protein